MKYVGSKRRLAKELLPIILRGRTEGQYYIEPFVGGANTISLVTGNRIGIDLHPQLIAMWKKLQEGWLPPETITEEDYNKARQGLLPDYLTGYIGFTASYGGKWFGGFARYTAPDGTKQPFDKQGYALISKQLEGIKGIEFHCGDYAKVKTLPSNSIIYCDPPYRRTTKYATKEMNYPFFYQWCRNKAKEGHKVFVSEYLMPIDFKCVWSKEVASNLHTESTGKRNVEKLFTLGDT